MFSPQPVPERFSFHIWHDVVQQAAGVTGVVKRKDVRVIELCGDPDFAEEALRAERGSEIGWEDLNGYSAAMLPVCREIDRTHPAPAELALDRVATPERRRDAGMGIGQANPASACGKRMKDAIRKAGLPADLER
jgi:hypothetical protein